MDHDQQVLQLRDFDQQVSLQIDNAALFATKSFLETLHDLIEYGLNQQDDGTDNYKEELTLVKDAIKAFSTVLPTVYKTICQNEAESRLWELCRTLITLVKTKLVSHGNAGVQINALKCLQILVLLLSKSTLKDLSLNLLRADHRLLNMTELEKEGKETFDMIIAKLKSDNESVLTATISCLVLIGRKRPQYLKEISSAFTNWRKQRSKDDSPVMLRNVDKALKLAFVALIRTEQLASYRTDLITAFGSIGGNVAMFQSRQSRAEESRRLKRAAASQQQHHEHAEKRVKTEYVPVIPPASSPNILVNYDITQIPLSAIVNLCMAVLQTVPLEVMQERVSILPAQGVTLAATRPGFVRSSTPPYPPPPEQPKYNTNPQYKTEAELLSSQTKEIKKEETIDSDEEMENVLSSAPPVVQYKEEEEVKVEEKPKVQLLASVEERASQALKMKPYELAKQTELSDFEKKELLKMSIQRIFDAESMFQLNGISSDQRAIMPTGQHTSSIWLLRIVKLITQGIPMTNTNEIPEEEDVKMDRTEMESSSGDLKELLLNYIIGNLSLRTDLALEWLHEEYLFDKRQLRLNSNYTSQYFYWFHQLLEKGIPTLDAKDKILTKLLLNAPELNEMSIEFVQKNLFVPERFVPCVSTLRNLVTHRPAIRFIALQVLLDLCINENDNIRITSIVAVKKWNQQPDIYTRVEEYAIQALNVLTNPKEDSEWTEKDVLRHAELYFVSCNKRPSLLKELFSVYIKSSEKVQEYIQIHMVKVIKLIGMKSSDLNKLLREFPPGGESLVIKILSIICESKPPTREIISIVQTIFEQAKERENIHVELLTPILNGHSLNQQENK